MCALLSFAFLDYCFLTPFFYISIYCFFFFFSFSYISFAIANLNINYKILYVATSIIIRYVSFQYCVQESVIKFSFAFLICIHKIFKSKLLRCFDNNINFKIKLQSYVFLRYFDNFFFFSVLVHLFFLVSRASGRSLI